MNNIAYVCRTTYRFLLHVKYTLLYGMAMTVSSLVHWPLMGGLLHLVLVGSFGIHADYVYLRGLTLCVLNILNG